MFMISFGSLHISCARGQLNTFCRNFSSRSVLPKVPNTTPSVIVSPSLHCALRKPTNPPYSPITTCEPQCQTTHIKPISEPVSFVLLCPIPKSRSFFYASVHVSVHNVLLTLNALEAADGVNQPDSSHSY